MSKRLLAVLCGCVCAGGRLLWRHELSATEVYESMCCDALDRRRLCLCGSGGALALVTLTNVVEDEVSIRHFKVDRKGGAGAGE